MHLTSIFRSILLPILLVIPTFLHAQQTVVYVEGYIKDQEGKPLPGSSVTVDGTSFSTSTNNKGYYRLRIQNGKLTIRYTFIGFKESVRTITVQNNSVEENITLESRSDALQQVEITGRKEKTYKTTSTFIGKNENQLKDVPQSVSYASKELIADQGLMRVGDVVKNFSGVNQFSVYDDLTIRGFRVNGQTNTQLLNGMRTSTGFWKQSLANYLERVEILKGPSSALFGNASPGGVLNRVTKKPLDESRKSVSFALGSFNTLRALGDFTGPATKDSSLLYRVNVGYENAESFRDLMFDKNIVIAPSLTFIPSDRTRINFDLVYTDSRSRLDRGQPIFGSFDLNSTPQSLSLNTTNDYLNEITYNASVSLNHKISNNLSLNASYMKTGYSEDLNEHRTSNSYALDGNGAPINNLAGMIVQIRQRKRFIDNFSGYLNYTPKTGIIEHKIVAGLDYGSEKTPVGGSQLTASGYRNAANNGSIASYVVANKSRYLLDAAGNPVPNVPHFNLSDPISSQRMQDDSKDFFTQSTVAPAYYYLNAGYVQDQLKIGALQVLLGIRYEYYTDYSNYKTTTESKTHSEAWLPRLGAVYTIIPNINVYGSYVKGYNPQTSATIANPNAGGPFDPLKSSMIEFGTKTSWFRDQLTVTAAVYKIKQTGALYNTPGVTDVLRQIGDEKSQGFEMDVIGKIMPNWNVIASYSYNTAKILDSGIPGEIGIQKPNTPKNSANLWSRYSFIKGSLQGFGVGFGINYIDKRNLLYDAKFSPDNQLTLPSYTLFNAALFYNIGKLQLQLNANNIGNKKHWIGGYDYLRLFPGQPENYMLTLGYSF
ncbi:TonB-dependent receptor [Pedobacter duraquae]|uniref:Iron complex outermembrane receptor protein n=1 Tax=Pedobacter duraquae TaxID=425511 RepID=A0A4R6IPR0_9SPHI|nr:TonB-dependent receptor [Pedobacter duraquae]TDO23935.1 iron complex outermembrane receptor protein [Pedobacter duraquae]